MSTLIRTIRLELRDTSGEHAPLVNADLGSIAKELDRALLKLFDGVTVEDIEEMDRKEIA
jgi:hypothetical protein